MPAPASPDEAASRDEAVSPDLAAAEPSRFATSADGTRVAVYDTGSPGGGDDDRPVVVAVHGYPDNARVWDGVTAALAGTVRVVRYDVRGAGRSDTPSTRQAYRIERLVEDLRAVVSSINPLDAPDATVHLLGHDWGSVQLWPALTDASLRGRIASFTSISGPSLDHVAAWSRRAFRHQPRLAASQAAHSYYIAMFRLPFLPDLLATHGVIGRSARRAEGVSAEQATPRTAADARNGLELYRANVFSTLRRPAPQRIDVPVQVIALRNDPFLNPAVCRQAPEPWVAELSTTEVPGGHWTMVRRPDEIAALVLRFVAQNATPRG